MSNLALCGGHPVMESPPSLRWPVFDATVEESVLAVVRSGQWWRGGTAEAQRESVTGRFERRFAAFQGVEHALAVNSGTTAVETALRAVGVSSGDEVIVPDLSFVVTGSACLTMGAWPVFVEVDAATGQIDPAAMEAAISPRTTAICLVHFGGYPADMDAVMAVAKRHNLAVVEDCAHAHGTQWRGAGVGSFGDFGTFSFQQYKSLTSGEGGLVVSNHLARWQSAYRYHNLGRLEHKGQYEFYELSSNLRLTDLQGALLEAQFPNFEAQVARRNEAYPRLDTALGALPGLFPQPSDKRITRRGFYYYILRYDAERCHGIPRERFLEALRAEGVPGVGKGYGSALHTYPLFQNLKAPAGYPNCDYTKVSCPVAERLATREVVTLAHQVLLLDDPTLDRIVEAFAKVIENLEELR